ncbi:hypothetical protein NG726_16415 [Pseudomonas sp. MOB-449]|nr:hypothetical protein [Pseudomonas sp. MOB-449]
MKHRVPLLLLASDDQALAAQAGILLDRSELNCTLITRSNDCRQMPLCRWFKDAPLSQAGHMQALLGEAIETLESTRHAFKSRELGRLRKRLQQALKELSGPI